MVMKTSLAHPGVYQENKNRRHCHTIRVSLAPNISDSEIDFLVDRLEKVLLD